MQRTRLSSKATTLAPSRGRCPGGTRTIWVSLCLAMAFALGLPPGATADAVSGRVYLDGTAVTNTTFTARPAARGRAVQFRSDASGNFSVYLDPGRYTVLSSDGTLEGSVDSYPQPVQQDIHLRRR